MTTDIGRELQALKARLARLERSARLSHAALDNTAIQVRDADGALRGAIGMQPDGTLGLFAQDGPPPGAPTAPGVEPSLGGLRVTWDGALADGSLLPADFDHVAVHMSTTSGFTPSAATFVGTIIRAGTGGMLPVTPLPYVEHFVRLVGVTTSAAEGPASAETAATPLRVDGPDLKAGSVTAAAIAAGAVTADKLEAVLALVTRIVAGDPDGARVELNSDGLRVYDSTGTLTVEFDGATGDAVFTGTVTGSEVVGGTVTGATVQTAATGQRIELSAATGEARVYLADGSVGAAVTPDGPDDDPLHATAGFAAYDGAFYAYLSQARLAFGDTGTSRETSAGISGFGTPSLVLESGRDTAGDNGARITMSGAPSGTQPEVYVTADGTDRLLMTVDGTLHAGNLASGRVTITPSAANTPTSVTVSGLTLPGTPQVTAAASTSVPGTQVTGVGVTGATSTGFTIWLTRTNTTATGIDWIAYAP